MKLTVEEILKIVSENTGQRISLSLNDLDLYIAVAQKAVELAKEKAYDVVDVKYRIADGCDCGCNDPVATNPKDMLEFLAGRLSFAGVSGTVGRIYARDIRLILKDMEKDECDRKT